MRELEAELDALFARPLGEFVQARNDLAAKLRKAGDREAADRVKALPKPSVSAWAVNQLYRSQRPEFEALLEAGDRLRDAQRDALAGKGTEGFTAASKAEREAVATLVGAARPILEAGGHAATDATLDRIGATLHALAGDVEGRQKLDGGRLTRDLDPSGFGGLAGLLAATPPGPKPREHRDELAERRIAKVEEAVAAAREEAEALGREADEAESLAEEARRAADAAEKTAERARALADRAAEKLARAEASLEETRERAGRE